MSGDLYRAFWRWHFYAGLLTLPFLAWLAATGSIYLFKDEIEHAVYHDLIVRADDQPALPVSQIIAATERETGGVVTQVMVPASTDETWRLRVEVGDKALTSFVDPGTARLAGSTPEGGVMKTVHDLHSLAITGTLGNALIEVAAGWGIVLIVTGIVLWWPSGRNPALALRGKPRQRLFWRDLHASIGAIGGAIILFLAMTGMPWSVFWGANVQRIVAEQGYGRPPSPGPKPWERHRKGAGHHSGAAQARVKALPWTMQAATMPHGSGHRDIGVDQATAVASSRGIRPPFSIALPQDHGDPYSISRIAKRADDARVLYLDAGSGKVLQDVSFGDFGKGAQLIEWGIATHQGQQYGNANRWVMLAGCVALLMLCLSAPVLWWKRRPSGHLAAPPRPKNARNAKPATIIAAAIGAIFPLTGVSMLVALFVDRTVFLRRATIS